MGFLFKVSREKKIEFLLIALFTILLEQPQVAASGWLLVAGIFESQEIFFVLQKSFSHSRNLFLTQGMFFSIKKHFSCLRNLFLTEEIFFLNQNFFFLAQRIFFLLRKAFSCSRNLFSAQEIFFLLKKFFWCLTCSK